MSSSHADIAHAWAHQSKPRLRGNNLSFEGAVISSYHHWPIGRIVGDVVLLRSESYSVSTSKHQSMARQATYHMKRFEVPNVEAHSDSAHIHNIMDRLEAAHEEIFKAYSATCNGHQLMSHGLATVQDMREYRDLFVPKFKHLWFKTEMFGEKCTVLRHERREYDAARQERYRKQNAAAIQRQAESLERWKAGEAVNTYFHTPDIHLRLVDFTVQTSKGAKVPLDQALILFRKAALCRNHHESIAELNLPLHRVGVYGMTMDSIDSAGNVKIGCHTIKFEEMERLYNTIPREVVA